MKSQLKGGDRNEALNLLFNYPYGLQKIIDEEDPTAEFAPWKDPELKAELERRKKEEADAKTRADMAVIMRVIREGNVKTIERSLLSPHDNYDLTIIDNLSLAGKKIFYQNPPGPEGAALFAAHINFDSDEINVEAIKSSIEFFERRVGSSAKIITNPAGKKIGLSCKFGNFDLVFSAREHTRNLELSEEASAVKKTEVRFLGEAEILWGDIPVASDEPAVRPGQLPKPVATAVAADKIQKTRTMESESWR